jgi:hypothetical protein
VRLDTRTQLLYDSTHLFINGAALRWPAGGIKTLKRSPTSVRFHPRAAAKHTRKPPQFSTLGTEMATSTPTPPEKPSSPIPSRHETLTPSPRKSRRSIR